MYRNCTTSPSLTSGLTRLLIALSACGQSLTAARFAGRLCCDTTPAEGSNTVERAKEKVLAAVLQAFDATAFASGLYAGRGVDHEGDDRICVGRGRMMFS